MSTDTYIRFPHIRGDRVVFVAENDVWLTGRDGGRAHRVSADHVPVSSPRLSPDGARVAWTAEHGGAREVHVAAADGGVARQLTYWGQLRTLVRGWLNDTEILVLSTTGQADRFRILAHAVPVDGGPSRRLPYGWAEDIALAPPDPAAGGTGGAGAALLSTPSMSEPAWRKRYRGGTAAQLWLDRDGDGEFRRIFANLTSSLVCPLWTRDDDGRQHLGFVSDHESGGQVYSATLGTRTPTASRLRRHTDGDLYARHASSDGRQVVYVAGGELFLLDSLGGGAEPRRVDVRLGGPRVALRPWQLPVDAAGLGSVAPDRAGRASVVEVRGTVHWLTHRDGPARALADSPGVRRREPLVLGEGERAVWVTDADGDDAVETVRLDQADAATRTLVRAGRVGRVLEMAASPDGRRLAVASHDGRLLLVDVPAGAVTRSARTREVDRTENGDVSGLAFSPDSRWLAWSAPGKEPLRQIRMCEVADARAAAFDVTPLRFTDTDPVFTTDGRHLAFLSVRSLDPVYDAYVFDLSFPNGCRPHLVPLAADTASPFAPRVPGRAMEEPAAGGGSGSGDGAAPVEPPSTRVDREGLDQRIVAVPVAGGRCSGLAAVRDGLVWLRHPLAGVLGDDRPTPEDEPARPGVEHLDLGTTRVQTLVDSADSVSATGDGRWLLLRDKAELLVVPATRRTEQAPEGRPDPARVSVDLQRVRVRVDPAAEWQQMYHEAWRLMRDHYWRPDLAGLDWQGARDRYAPMLRRIGSHDDLVDLIWEMHGELATSHAYCIPAPPDPHERARQGLLGADIEYDGEHWRITRVVPGESSDRRARSPLTAPGVAASAGDAITAVDGRATTATTGPGPLLVGAAGRPVELTLAPSDGSAERRVVVLPLDDELPLRYQDWVHGRRAYVHRRTDSRVGYLHVPDMVSGGWAQLHRDLRTEVGRDGLIVDVRGNRGGHTSQLVVEKLARSVVGWALGRGYQPESYPGDARRGPMVAVADMFAGSDGDIVTAAIRSLGIGTVVGTRTWGGVVGIDGRYRLVDGTTVTQPRYAFWFEDFGWDVENHGVDPDVEVVATPQERVRGEDAQLDHAVTLVSRQLRASPAKQPPSVPDLRGAAPRARS